MPEEKKDSKPTPRINASTTPKSKPEFRLATDKEVETITPKGNQPAPKPIVPKTGGFQTPRQGSQQVSSRDTQLMQAASKGAQALINESFRVQTIDEQVVRDKELESIVGKDLTFDNLFKAVHNPASPMPLSIGGGKYEVKVNNADELGQALQDPYNLDQFFLANRSELAQYFRIGSSKELTDKLQGGLTQYEKSIYSNQDAVSVYDPRFNKPFLAANAPRYNSSLDQFASDPVAEKFGSVQKRIEADRNFNTLRENNLNVDAYGQPIDNASDFYEYLKDPINRDSYGRVHKKKLNELGFTSAQDLFASSYYDKGKLGIDIARYEDQKEIRRSNAEKDMATEFLNKTATVFDENDQSSSVAKLDEEQIGKMLFEAELGNNISFDYQDPNYRSSFKKLDRDEFENILRRNNLDDVEVADILEEYKSRYMNNMVGKTYQEKRSKAGFIKNEKGQLISNYDEIKENRAQAELTKEEREIAALYEQVQEIYKSGVKVKGKNQVKLSPDQFQKLQALKNQISQKKQDVGFFGVNALPKEEFFDAFGNRLEGKEKQKVVKVYTQTAQAEQKTDAAILKEKRNVLYEQLDYMSQRFKDMQSKKVVLPDNYSAEELDAEYKTLAAENGNFLQKLYALVVPFSSFEGTTVVSDQQKANAIYLYKLNSRILEKKAQIKALNRVIYTNADITKLQAEGIVNNMANTLVTNTVNLVQQEEFQTPAEEVLTVANFLTEQGMYVNPNVVESLKTLNEDSQLGKGFLTSLAMGLQIGLMRKPVANSTKALFTGEAAVAARSYMANKYGQTGVGVFTLFEKAAVNYGVDFLAYELAGQDGGMGVAEKVGSQMYDRATGIMNLGRFLPTNLIGKMATVMGRSFSGAAASMTEETFSNIWSEFKANGFDIVAATENAYGKTEDERLFNLRATALMCMSFSSLNLENLGVLFKTRQNFQDYLDRVYGEDVDAVDVEILKLLDQTIKNSDYDENNTTKPEVVTAPAMAVAGFPNATNAPSFAFNPVMTSGPVEDNTSTTTSSSASSGAGTEGVKVEQRAGNLGEEFYVSSKNGVVDNKVVYRYNPETTKLEAKGLTSVTDEFVEVNDKTAEFIDKQSKEYGIVSKANVENVAKANLGIDPEAQAAGQVNKDQVLFQNNTSTGRSKKERIDKAAASTKTRYASQFNMAASQIFGLFTNTAKEADVNDDAVRTFMNDISRKIGNKLKLNMTSFVKDGVAYISNASRSKLNKVASYIAPLLKEFDDTLFNTEDQDLNTNQPIRTRKKDAVTDKVRESVSRNNFFNEVFGDMINDGRITKEDAIDNFIGILLINSRSKVKEVLGNDKAGLDAFTKLRADLNNFVAVKYTGASTFGTTEKFLNGTVMSTNTTKNRKSDLKKQVLDLEKEKQNRLKIKGVLKSTQKEGAFVTDDQVDAIRFNNGDISALEFLQNIGKDIPQGATQQDITNLAKAESANMVDATKYEQGVELIKQNDRARERYRKHLFQEAGLVWGFRPSLKSPFKARRSRKERKAYIEAYVAAVEEASTRAEMTLQTFMETQIGVLKRTEDQFLDFLKMTPQLNPLYQMSANYSPEYLIANIEKANDLKSKGFTDRQIEVMTGLTIGQNGEATITPNNINVEYPLNFLRNVEAIKNELADPLAKKTNAGKILGRFTFSKVDRNLNLGAEKTIINLNEFLGGSPELLAEYPDLSQVKVRLVMDNTSAAFSFRPNELYTGKGKSQGVPGSIIINVNQAVVGKDKLGLENAIRQAVQHMEGQYDSRVINDFVTPTTIRAKIMEAAKADVLDKDATDFMNSVLNFYIDKGVFQFGSYQSLFLDIAQILYKTPINKNLDDHFEKLGAAYSLSDSDINTLKSIYMDYVAKTKSEGKAYNNTFNFAMKLGSLSDKKLIDFDFASTFANRLDYTLESENVLTIKEIFSDESFVGEIPSLLSGLQKLIDHPDFVKFKLNGQVQVLLEAIDILKNEVKEGKINPNTVYQIASYLGSREGKDVVEFLDNLGNEYAIDEFDAYGNVVGTQYLVADQFGFNGRRLLDQVTDLSDALFDASSLINSKINSSNLTGAQQPTTAVESKEVYYQLFPGIDKYMDGIYDPFKKITDFTKQQLKSVLVNGGLISEARFNQVYGEYESSGAFAGSVASNFLETRGQLNKEETQRLIEFNTIQKSMMENYGTSFYNNVDLAVSRLVTSAKRYPSKDLRAMLKTMGAKDGELDWLGLSEFIDNVRIDAQSKNPAIDPNEIFITKDQLIDWLEDSHRSVISYNPADEFQTSTVESVVLLSASPEIEQGALTAFGTNLPFTLNSNKFDQLNYFGGETGSPNAVVRFANGGVRVINLQDINVDNLTTFKNYIGSEEYAKLADIINNIEKAKESIDTDASTKELIKSYIKSYVNAEEELLRLKRYRGATGLDGVTNLFDNYESFKPDLGSGAVPNTYKEHLISVPVTQNPLYKEYNNRVLLYLEQLNDLAKTPEDVAKNRGEIAAIQQKLEKARQKRDDIGKELYNSKHFSGNPLEVIGHLRTEIVLDSDGNLALFVHEMQSDKSQARQEQVKKIKNELFSEFMFKEIFKFKNAPNYGTGFAIELNKFLNDNKNKIEQVIGRKVNTADYGKPTKWSPSDIDKLVELTAEYAATLRNEKTLSEAFKKFDEQTALDKRIVAIKKDTPLLHTDNFMDMLIKQAIKVASDNGLSKIIFTGGGRIGPSVAPANKSVAKTRAGINKTYNEKIPSRLKNLQKKLGFTLGTSQVSGDAEKLQGLNLDQEVDVNGKMMKLSDMSQEELMKYLREYVGSDYLPNSEFNSIELSQDTLLKAAEGQALFQQNKAGAHGAFLKTESGKNLIFALTNPNITTAMHELAHMFEHYMTAHEKQVFMDEVGHSTWSKDTSELFARGFEKFLGDGKIDNPAVKSAFENFKSWLLRIYGGIVGTPIEMQVSDPMRKIYNAMLNGTTVADVKQQKSSDVIDDIGNFIADLKANPQFKGITDEELYTALMKSGFEPDDIKDYFSLKQRANIEKQKTGKGLFEDEATVMENDEDAMRVVRDKKELLDAMENIDPTEYPMLLKTLSDVLESGDVLLAKEIELLLQAKHSGADPETIRQQYAAILKTGTQVGRMLRMFRQLTQDTYTTSTQAMIDKLLKKGESLPEKAKEEIMDLAREVDRLKELYKASREQAMANPYGQSPADASKTNFEYHKDLYDKLTSTTEKYIAARAPYEGGDSKTDAFRSFIKGGLMTPGSLSVNTTSNIVKLFVGFFTDPLRTAVSYIGAKTGLVDKQYTKVTWSDIARGIKYGMPMGLKKGLKILKDGTVSQGLVDTNNYAQGFNSFKAFSSYFGLKLDQMKRAAGYSSITDEELAYKHGFRINALGKIPDKQQSVRALEATFGIIPDIIFRVMSATDAVFRDFAYMTSVSEDFKQSVQATQLEKRIDSTTDKATRQNLIKEYNDLRKAFLIINQDYGNPVASQEALNFVYANDNWVTEQFARMQRGTRNFGPDGSLGSFVGKISRLFGTSTIPFTKIPTNYAVELTEFLVPEYALFKVANAGKKAYDRGQKLKSGATTQEAFANERRTEARNMDRVMARAMVGAGLQYIALEFVKAGALSGGPQDEKEDDKIKSSDFSYQFERPYSINLTLAKEHMKEKLAAMGIGEPYKSSRLSKLWDRENDFIIDYRGFGVMGAALYFQYKENKHRMQTDPKFVNRGAFEEISEEFASSLFGNYESAYKYIIDQTFVRGVLSIAKAISDDDENKLPNFFADITLTMASAIVPNSLSWIDKWRREYTVDYDSRDAEPFKAFGIQVENESATLFFTKLATKLSERWPFGDPTKYVNLPFVESQRELLPVKVDPFGKRILQTPKGSVLGEFMYNTFDITKATKAYAGYEIPDWEALAYLCCKMEAWNALPQALPRKISTPSGAYKMTPDEYNNILEYNAMLRRQMIQDVLIDADRYKEMIDLQSSYNRREDGTMIMGINNPKTPFGFELMARIMSDIYNISNQMTLFANYTFIDKEREKLYRDDPERYMQMLQSEMQTATRGLAQTLYGGQELEGQAVNNLNEYVGGFMNVTDAENAAGNKFFRVDQELIQDPKRFKKFATGAIDLVKQFDKEGKTIMKANATGQPTGELDYEDIPLNTPKTTSKQSEGPKTQKVITNEEGFVDIPL
jgi:hypothetical protein